MKWYDPTSVPHKSVELYLNLRGSPTYQTSLSGWALRLGLRPYQISGLKGQQQFSEGDNISESIHSKFAKFSSFLGMPVERFEKELTSLFRKWRLETGMECISK